VRKPVGLGQLVEAVNAHGHHEHGQEQGGPLEEGSEIQPMAVTRPEPRQDGRAHEASQRPESRGRTPEACSDLNNDIESQGYQQRDGPRMGAY
jgi:hypothetical protein